MHFYIIKCTTCWVCVKGMKDGILYMFIKVSKIKKESKEAFANEFTEYIK